MGSADGLCDACGGCGAVESSYGGDAPCGCCRGTGELEPDAEYVRERMARYHVGRWERLASGRWRAHPVEGDDGDTNATDARARTL